jgi:Flp pilus assembly protein TadD
MAEVKSGNRRTAARCFQRAVELAPENAIYQRDLGVALYALGRTEDATERYREVVRLSPNDGQAHFNLAALLLMQRNPPKDEARAMYEKALQLGEARDASIENKLAAP